MKNNLSLILAICSVLTLTAQRKMTYPAAFKDTTSTIHHDTSIMDPYQYMENLKDDRLLSWIDQQEKLTKKMENKMSNREYIMDSAFFFYKTNSTSLVDEDTEGDVKKYDFKFKLKSEDRSKDLMYKKEDDLVYSTLVSIKDLQRNSEDKITIKEYKTNEEETLIAVMIDRNGTDWREVYFFDLVTGERYSEYLKNLYVGSSMFWHRDGLIYTRYDAPEDGRELIDWVSGARICYHKLDESQEKDKILNNEDLKINYFTLIGKRKDKLFFNHLLKASNDIYKAISYAEISSDTLLLKRLLVYPFHDSIGMELSCIRDESIFLKTNWKSPKGRVLKIDFNKPNQPSQFIPEFDILLEKVMPLGGKYLSCSYFNQGQRIILVFDYYGNIVKKFTFPKGKNIDDFYEHDEEAEYTNYYISSFYHPRLKFKLNLDDLSSVPANLTKISYKYDDIETRYVLYPSADGTEVPMFITCKKDVKLDGKNPTLIYAYGGYGKVIDPSFNPYLMTLIHSGGVYAVPDVRGGGGRNSEWSKLGQGLNKKNSINDLIAAAEYLVDQGYSSNEYLALNGRSHGGMLVAAAAVKRPDLFKAVIAEAGLYDMLRYEQYTIGETTFNKTELGSVESEEGFRSLMNYSPLHNIKEDIKYPDFLMITGDYDNRVVPFHTYKFLATLQEKGDPSGKYLLYLEKGTGHFSSGVQRDAYDTQIYKYGFLADRLGLF